MGEGGRDFNRLVADKIADRERRTRDAVAALRGSGYSAAHPDDGWVDRERGRLVLANPHFVDGEIRRGSLVAIGDVDREFRAVLVMRVEDGPFGLRCYYFEDAGERTIFARRKAGTITGPATTGGPTAARTAPPSSAP